MYRNSKAASTENEDIKSIKPQFTFELSLTNVIFRAETRNVRPPFWGRRLARARGLLLVERTELSPSLLRPLHNTEMGEQC